jgi:hypothetical protein
MVRFKRSTKLVLTVEESSEWDSPSSNCALVPLTNRVSTRQTRLLRKSFTTCE